MVFEEGISVGNFVHGTNDLGCILDSAVSFIVVEKSIESILRIHVRDCFRDFHQMGVLSFFDDVTCSFRLNQCIRKEKHAHGKLQNVKGFYLTIFAFFNQIG